MIGARKGVTAAGVSCRAILRVARGRYRLPNAPVTEHHGLALVAAAAPKVVICLLSALNFHQIGAQLPHEVWVALDRRSRRPSQRYPRLHVVRFGGDALTQGIETHRVEGEACDAALSRGARRVTVAPKGAA
jgi:predicted transcriptional regulator of viral defense system